MGPGDGRKKCGHGAVLIIDSLPAWRAEHNLYQDFSLDPPTNSLFVEISKLLFLLKLFERVIIMSMFPGASQVAVTGGIQVATGAGGTVIINSGGQAGIIRVLKDLSAHAAHAALHDSAVRFNAPRCHRNTRTTHLDGLERWMLGQWGEYADARLVWLNGGAGAGKSAIMQSIVERCTQYGVILGTFFFSRTDPSRNHAEVLIPTLAYQLACAFPAAMTVLEPFIKHDPLIFKASLHTQAHKLLVCPLRYLIEIGAIKSTNPLRRVFVIDGLDECDDSEKQALIIRVVATVLSSDNLGPICFLIGSRPELAICRAFQREYSLKPILMSITLHDNPEARHDIRQFIEDSFLDILDTHPLRDHIPSGWPKPHSVDELVKKSSGHFIYAATAMKFITSSDEHPTRALQVVEGLMPARMGNPFAELDALYLHILTSAKYRRQVLDILRHCVLTELDNSVTAICFIYPNISPKDMTLFLSDVQALVSVQPNDKAEICIHLKHASLCDFLRDANRSHANYMSKEEYGPSVLPSYFRLLHNGPQVGTTWLLSSYTHRFLMYEIRVAITHTQDRELLQSLISGCSPQIVWDFCMKSAIHYHNGLSTPSRANSVCDVFCYMRSIRDSVANHDDTLYTSQFKVFNEILMDDLNKLIQSEPRYRIIPALIFLSSPSCLTFLAPLLIRLFQSLQIHWDYCHYFLSLQLKGHDKGVIDPRSYEVIRRLPQSQLPWGRDLPPTLKQVLQHLLGYSWTPEHLQPNPHARWLRRMKPLKNISQGSSKLSSVFYSHLRRLPTPSLDSMGRSHAILKHYMSTRARADTICQRREECFILLKTVICYLHKSDCTSDIAKLARKSLPKAALWFPKLMKKARVKMDAYVRRWDDSPEGLLGKAQSLSINDLD